MQASWTSKHGKRYKHTRSLKEWWDTILIPRKVISKKEALPKAHRGLIVIKESMGKMRQCEMGMRLINIYSKYVQQEICNCFDGFITCLSGNNRTSRQNAKKDTDALCTMMNKLDLIYTNTAPNNCRSCIYFKYIWDILHVHRSKWKYEACS